jgi:hypothetical protein
MAATLSSLARVESESFPRTGDLQPTDVMRGDRESERPAVKWIKKGDVTRIRDSSTTVYTLLIIRKKHSPKTEGYCWHWQRSHLSLMECPCCGRTKSGGGCFRITRTHGYCALIHWRACSRCSGCCLSLLGLTRAVAEKRCCRSETVYH